MNWSIKEIDSHKLDAWLSEAKKSFRIIDVREIREILAGTINGAEPMPLATLPARLSEFHPTEELVMICRSGARSAQACGFLQQQGFENVYNLQGGMLAWASKNLPIARPSPA